MVDLKKYDATWLRQFFSNHRRLIGISVVLAVLISVFAIKMQKSVAIVVDGKNIKVSTYKSTVNDILESTGIKVGKKDKIMPGLDERVSNGTTIAIKRAVPINVTVDGKKLVIYTAEKTVGKMFKAEGIVLNDLDKVSPKLQASVQKGLSVKVTRVTENTVTITNKVAYKVYRKTNDDMSRGTVKVLRDGVDGEKQISYKVIYEDGKEVSRIKVGEVVKKAPVDKLVAVGSLAWFTPTGGARKVYFTKMFRMKATSYTANFKCTGKRPGDKGFGRTATGTIAKRDRNSYSTVAVDKSMIPLGTKLYIEGYGYAIAEDVGGGVRGKIIDLYFNPGSPEFRNWFTHRVNVYVLK